MFKAQSLTCRRGKRVVFREAGFTLDEGGLLLVKGRNGSGKSSFLRVVAGLLPTIEGRLFWNGREITDFTTHRARLHYLGHLDALKPELTVNETVDYWHALRNTPRLTSGLLDSFDLAKLGGWPVRNLSAGQKRRLTLARLRIGDASLWLLDEPATALDTKGHKLLATLLAQHRTKGGMAIVATHQPEDFKDAKHLSLDGASA